MKKLLIAIVITFILLGAKVFAAPPDGFGPTGTITGHVEALDYPIPGEPGTAPKEGVKVHIAGTSLFAYTDANGDYTINNVPVGPLYTVIAYDVDPNLSAGIGTTWLNVWSDDAVRFGVYLTSSNQTLTLPSMIVNHSFLGAP